MAVRDLAGLEALLASDLMLTTDGDGGGKIPALARSLRGHNRVALVVINSVRRVARIPGVLVRLVEVNGGPGALYLDATAAGDRRVRARHRRR